jgi:molecular chaperone DnaK (HSP70)
MGDAANSAPAEAERFAIGISFGNSCSSIARISPVRPDVHSLG